MASKPIDILIVEDNPGDVRLASEGLKESKIDYILHVIDNGQVALDYLHRRGSYENAARPDLVILDLNLPGKHGFEVLENIKSDAKLSIVPIIMMSVIDDENAIMRAYKSHANCYIGKPLNSEKITHVMKFIANYWSTSVQMPPKAN